ncbi:MAG: hypothetical protein J6V93_02315 [Clostridia bacterium]|nr:hypothetical protein [Clostridia bacterium]
MKIQYRTNISSTKKVDLNLTVGYGTSTSTARLWGPKPEISAIGTWQSLVLDLSSLVYTGGDGGYYAPTDENVTIWDNVNNLDSVIIKPYYSNKINEGDYFDVLYVGFYETLAEARKASPEAPENYYFRGDANGDFTVNTVDEILISRALTDPEETYELALDVNGDSSFNAIDHLLLARNIAGWKKYQSFYASYAEDDYIDSLNDEFEERRDEILNSESEWTVAPGGRIYYISPNGDDDNDGRSEDTPWKSFSNLTSAHLISGDVVLLERGGVWREQLYAHVEGVTFSAYGEGPKPAIYGSIDASDPSSWTEVSDNLWKYVPKTFYSNTSDIGSIVFNHGEAYGARVFAFKGTVYQVGMNGITSNGIETWESRPTGAFSGVEELDHDLEYCIYYGNSYYANLHLYSEEGNPAERFDSIEISTKGHAVVGKSNCTFDNLAIKYTGSHGISMTNIENVTVRNCEIGWIGGAIQTTSPSTTRFGNGIEVYGSCNNFKVYNNYVYECFDCGITVQHKKPTKTTIIKDTHFYDNVIERCNSPLESWAEQTEAPQKGKFMFMNNVVIEDNLCRRSGYGFGGYIHINTNNNMFYGGSETNAIISDCFIRNNKMWDIRNIAIRCVPLTTNYGKGFIWMDNTIIKELGSNFIQSGSNMKLAEGDFTTYKYNNDTLAMLELYKSIGYNNLMFTFPDDE